MSQLIIIMNKWCSALIPVPGFILSAALLAGPTAIGIRYDKVLDFAEEKAATLAETVLNGNSERFADYTTESGIWKIKTDATWTSGFQPGIFWYLYAMTGDTVWQERAKHWTEGVRSRATATDNDTGFQIYESFGVGRVFDPAMQAAYNPVLLQGAATLVNERYNSTIGAFRSWDQNISNPTTLPFEVIIDQMMNLELVLWAGLNGGPQEYVDYAIRHADTSWENLVREDGSTFHVVAYNLDGTIDYKRTHQGWKRDSTWSRGQAWATYGYVMVYRYTGLPRMLERAETCYRAFMRETLKDARDYIPYSDFDAPLDSNNPRDSSAAAIVASAAIELYGMTGNPLYRFEAETILESLSSPAYLSRGTPYQSILRKASLKWGTPEVGAMFADFYLLEAMYRWMQLDPAPVSISGQWEGYDIQNGIFSDTGDWLGWLKVHHAPYLYNFIIEDWMFAPEEGHHPSGSWIYVLDIHP